MLDLQVLARFNKNLSVSLASWLLHYFEDAALWPDGLRENFRQAIEQACLQFHQQLKQAKTTSAGRKDPRAEEIAAHLSTRPEQIKLFTDYEVLLNEVTLLSNDFIRVETMEEADFIFTMKQIKNFLTVPVHQRVSQFPYESAIIRKDLLPLTVRQYCFQDGKAPNWWLPCYDLSTEFHVFAEEHQRRSQLGLNNRWILKPAQGTRGFGHRIVEDSSPQGLHFAALLAPALPEAAIMQMIGVSSMDALNKKIGSDAISYDNMDRVAQLLVDQPVLLKDRKFDSRYFVLVRSFEPFEAYVHELSYSRLSYKPYSNDELHDPRVAITVCCYDENEEIASSQDRVFHSKMQEELDKQYGEGVLDWKDMKERTVSMFRELFTAAGKAVGQWPNSSAYYSVDVIYDLNHEGGEEEVSDATHLIARPRLLEVNFLGDWHGVDAAVEDDREQYFQWATDVLTVLSLPADKLPLERLTKL